MNYQEKFNELKDCGEKALISFVVIGDPNYELSLDVLRILADKSDMLELGFAFSDPIADGSTIQSADVRALNSGMNTDRNFRFIKEIRKFTDKPIGLLLYSNLVYQYGIDRFYFRAKEVGVNSILIADMPIEESEPYIKSARKYNIDSVFIISPLTKERRLRLILKETRGFVYLVSRLGVTGIREDIQKSTLQLIRQVRTYTTLPVCVGFGISKPDHIKAVLEAGADGVIIGSAIVNIIEHNLKSKNKMLENIKKFIIKAKEATKL